jgi:RNA polymerase sigma-70 factor (ECF subfamily)
MTEMTEYELIAGSKRGDKEALTELFRRHYPICLRLACAVLRSEQESQDVVQSAYFSAFRHFHRFRGDASFKTWITRIVINQCLMLLREPRHRLTWISLDDPETSSPSTALASSAPTPERSVLSGEIGSALSDAIARLPKPMREVFTLCTVSGFSVKEAAAALGLTVPAAKTRLFRAQTRMRSSLLPVWSTRRSIAA